MEKGLAIATVNGRRQLTGSGDPAKANIIRFVGEQIPMLKNSYSYRGDEADRKGHDKWHRNRVPDD